MPPKNACKFSEGEKVLCFHGPLIYEAKCLKVQVRDKVFKYFIHYAGWNKNWDEWVPESRVLKYNDSNIQRQKELKKAHDAQVNSRKSKGVSKLGKPSTLGATPTGTPTVTPSTKRKAETTVASSSTETEPKVDTKEEGMKAKIHKPPVTPSTSTEESGEPKRKRGRPDSTVETEEQFTTKVEVKIKIPDELKPWLVDDWDLIVRQRKLFNLPAQCSADDILEKYIAYKRSSKANNFSKESAVVEVTKGIREYFNATLGTQLLYKFERPQYSDMLQEYSDKSMSSLYGGIHLLRLFVKIGGMLAYTPLDERSVQLLTFQLQEFLRFLQKHASTLFSHQEYGIAPPEYHRKTM